VIMGIPRRSIMETALKGDVIRVVSHLLPEEIQLVIFGGGSEAVTRVPEKPPTAAPEKQSQEAIQA